MGSNVRGGKNAYWCMFGRDADWQEKLLDIFDRDGHYNIYVVNPDGTNLTSLTDDQSWKGNLAWSPNGEQIVFESDRDNALSTFLDLCILDVNSGTVTGLVTDYRGPDTEPAWSPDGGRIAFVSDRLSDSDIYFVYADGSNMTLLTPDNLCSDHSPDWSPDSQHLVYVSDCDGNDEIYVMEIITGMITRLTFRGATEGLPAWQP